MYRLNCLRNDGKIEGSDFVSRFGVLCFAKSDLKQRKSDFDPKDWSITAFIVSCYEI